MAEQSLPQTPGVEYLAIAGFPGYAIGNDGIPWTCKRGPWRPLAMEQRSDGYRRVMLQHKGQVRRAYVHQLVLEAFVGPCPVGMECRHFPDSTRSNNNLTNLSWGTRLENHDDQYVHGTRIMGESHHRSAVTDAEVVQIRERFAAGESAVRISTDYRIGRDMVLRIAHGKNWQHVGGPIVPSRRKMTREQVVEIRKLLASVPASKVAEQFGISEGMVSMIKRGQRWSSA